MSPERVGIRAGAGLVVRAGDLVAVLGGTPADLDEMYAAVDQGAGGAALAVTPLSPTAAFALVRPVAGGVEVTAHGAASCTVTRSGHAVITVAGSGSSTVVIDDPVVVSLVLDTAEDSMVAHSDLVVGVVPGSGVDAVYVADPPTLSGAVVSSTAVGGPSPSPLPPPPPPPPPGSGPLPLPELATPALNLLLEPLDASERLEPLPVGTEAAPPVHDVVWVRGLACSVGHVNRLDALYCSSCGRRLQGTVNLVEGPRPSLGTLIFDDGTAYGLDIGYLIGRDPSGAPDVLEGRARPIVLPDPDRTMSRVHAEIRLDGWDVRIVDRGSANGTFVAAPGAMTWKRVGTDDPVVLDSGSTVTVGRRTFVFQQR